MSRTEIALLSVFAAALAIGIAVWVPAAQAQQPEACRPTEIVGVEGGLLDGASGEQTLQVITCAPGNIAIAQGPIPTVLRAPDGPIIERVWRNVFDVRPCSLAGGSDLPGAQLTVAFRDGDPAPDASWVMTLAPDKDKPTLTTTSTPRKGTKVKPGDTIKIRMEASEEYAPARLNWQTGVKKLQLIDEGPNPVVTPHWEGTEMRACAAKQWKQFLEVSYLVPANPPPVIRLRAIAEDFAGNQDVDVAEFPTGDWYGTFNWTHTCQGGGNKDETVGKSDLALDNDGRGNLTGTLTGSTPERRQTIPPCSFASVAPGTFNAKLLGSYTPRPETFSAQAVDVRTTPGRASFACPSGSNVVDLAYYEVYGTEIFRDAFRDLRRQPDGSWTSSGKSTASASGGSCTTTHTLTLRRAM